MNRSYLLILVLLGIQISAFSQTGPAGVGTAASNRLWLKADANVYKDAGTTLAVDGDFVQQWNDRSGNINNATQGISANRPTYKTNIINGRPALLFGGDSFVDPSALGILGSSGFTYIVLFNATSVSTGALTDGAGDYIVDRTTGTNELAGLKFTNNGGSRYAVQKRDDAGNGLGGPESAAAVTTSTFHLVDFSRERIPGALYRLYLDGALNASLSDTDGALTPPVPRIGRHATTTNGGLKGYIAEFIIYNYRLNDAEVKIVNSYLAAKYNISSIANDKYSFDATHGNDVAGIGSEGAGNLNADAISASILEINTASSMATGDYLLFGHDNGSIAAWTTTEAPNSGVNIQRLPREWRLNETGDANGVGTMKFSISNTLLPALTSGYTKYGLMVDTDGDFSSGASVYEMSLVSGSTYETASNIDINNGNYVAIAEIRPTIGFDLSTSAGFETSNASLAVSLNYIAKSTVSVTVNTANVSAIAGSDYTAITGGTLNITAGNSTANVTVTIANDVAVETDETFTVTLSSPSAGINLGTTVHTYTIHDDDAARKIFFGAASSSGNENVLSVNINVTDNPVDGTNPTRVDYSVTGGTATGGGVDFTLASGTATILATQTTTTINLAIVNDLLYETNETIIITLTNPVNCNLSSVNPIVYTYTILDNDIAPTIQFTSASGSGSESVTPANFPVSLSAAAGVNVSVNYSVTGGSAVNGTDFTLASGTLTIPAGSTTGNISAVITDDALVEFAETIVVTLASPNNASLGVNTVYTYTILDNDVFGFKGPGGVGDQNSNKLWVSADVGVYNNAGTTLAALNDLVQQWNDRSGNANHVTQPTSGSRPQYKTSVVNTKPAILFNNNFMDAGALGITGAGGFTYFTVLNATSVGSTGTNGDGSGDYILDRSPLSNELVSLKINSGNTFGLQKRDNNNNGLGGPNTAAFTTGTFYMIDFLRERGTSYRIYLNGTGTSVADADGDLTPPATRIGRHQSSATQGLKGNIAELAIYNTYLNTAQRIIVENYLAAKYNLPILAASDKFAYRTTYGNEVAGIGMQDASNYHTDAQGSSFVRINAASNMDPGDYFLWGHDNGILTSTETVDIPAGIQARLKRVWRVSESADLGTMDISFDLTGLGSVTASDLRLLVDKANNGFADETVGAGTIISGASSVGSNVYRFSGVNINDTWKFTLATINKTITALPIELLSFGAKAEGNKVNVTWTTASEHDNDFFTVQRSKEGTEFEEIGTVKGAGTTTEQQEYIFTDTRPYSGVSYYRLKQTDFSLKQTLSKIVSVNVDKDSEIAVYPNPSHSKITIDLKEEMTVEITLFNNMGQRVLGLPPSKAEIIGIDVSSLAKGIYVLKINKGSSVEVRKLLVD